MLKYIFVFTALFSQLCCYEAQNYKIIEDKAAIQSLNPEFKMKKTLKIELENGLQAYLISDPETSQSAVALTVLTGSWSNPEEHPGIAHFLEHMLFLGTKKYPIESDYDHFLIEHGGTSNAFTGSDFTGYLFGVNNDGFVEALDRFSNFFVEPLFNPSGVGRELNAIDQEYSLNSNIEARRQSQVFREIGNPKHPFHRFDMGNSQTLSQTSQENLKDWFATNYSANIMRLFVYSNLPIDELRDLVIKDFSPIPNKNIQRPIFKEPLLKSELNGHVVYIKPSQDIRKLDLLWEMPKHFANMQEAKPEEIICYILGHQGPESLLAKLKKEDLAEELSCSGSLIGINSLFFELQIGLTAKGLAELKTVITLVFQAINNLQQNPLPNYIFDDVQKLSLLRYQYQPREDAFVTAMKNGLWLPREELETYPELTLTLRKKDPQAALEFARYLTPENCIFSLSASPTELKINFDLQEKWMGVQYAIEKWSKDTLLHFNEAVPSSEITLPQPNPFIPSHLNLVGSHFFNQKDFLNAPNPEKIVDNSSMIAYFSPDMVYQSPKTYLHLTIKTPSLNNGSPQSSAMAELYVKAFEDQIDAISYDARIADLEFELQKTLEGFEFTFYGFNESILKFLKLIGPKIILSDVPAQKFETYKDTLSREYNNLSKEYPVRFAFDIMRGIIYENYSINSKKLEALSNIELNKFKAFAGKLFTKTYIEAIVTGNISKDQAIESLKDFEKNFKSKPYPPQEQIPVKVLSIPNDKGPFFIKAESQTRGNAALLAIEGKSFSIQERNMQQMLGQAIKEAFFSELRTKQQTGYAVQSISEDLEKHLFTFFGVQSNSHEPIDLLYRFEQFIESYLRKLTLTEIPENRFELLRKWLLTELQTPPKNLKLMGERLTLIGFTYEDFNWTKMRIEALKKLNYDEFVSFVNDYLGRDNKRRLGVLIDGQSDGTKFRYTPFTVAKFKATAREWHQNAVTSISCHVPCCK